jgi:hypothetical protein
MNDDNSSSSSSSAAVAATSRQLVRRLSGIGRAHWIIATDIGLVRHLSAAHTLPDLDILSECIVRMAEHFRGASVRAQREFFSQYSAQFAARTDLCTAAGAALQQLAQGLSQYMQQGQLPATLTQRAVEACCALCCMLSSVCRYASEHLIRGDDYAALRQWYHGSHCTTGEPGLRQCCAGVVVAATKLFAAPMQSYG